MVVSIALSGAGLGLTAAEAHLVLLTNFALLSNRLKLFGYGTLVD